MSRYISIFNNLPGFRTCCCSLAIQDWYNIPKYINYIRYNTPNIGIIEPKSTPVVGRTSVAKPHS